MNCCGPTVPPPNARSKSLVETLRILMYIQLVVGIVKLFTSGSSSFGFSDLICCLLIYQGYNSLMHWSTVMALFFEGFSFVSLFATIGAAIQNGQSFFVENPLYFFPTTFSAIINLLSVPLYITVMLYCFYAYREFKALAYEGIGGGFGPNLLGGAGATYGGSSNQQQQQYAAQHDEEQPREEASTATGNFTAFGGRGVTIG